MSPAFPDTATSGQEGRAAISTTASDGLLATAAPIWQIVIGGCVLVFLVAASARLVRRGRSRMTTALVVVGATAVSLAIIGVLTSGR
jgi:hypothetical protein